MLAINSPNRDFPPSTETGILVGMVHLHKGRCFLNEQYYQYNQGNSICNAMKLLGFIKSGTS